MFSQVLQSHHHPAAVLWEVAAGRQWGFTDSLKKNGGRFSKCYENLPPANTKKQVLHLASTGVELCDGVLRGDQQWAGFSSHWETLRGAGTLQLWAPEALQQLQIPHFTSGLVPKAEDDLRQKKEFSTETRSRAIRCVSTFNTPTQSTKKGFSV